MTTVDVQQAVQVARENIEAFNAGDWQRARATLAAGVVMDEVATNRLVEGADEAVELLRGWKQAFSDARGTVTNAFGTEDTAVLEVTYEGTHDGSLETPQGSIPPSGKTATVRGVMVVRVADGKIVEAREYFDLLTLLGQIGAAPQG